MFETAMALLCAHLIADFPCQTKAMVANKKNFGVLILHIAIVTGLSAMLLGALHPQLLGLIAISHLAADFIKTHYSADDAPSFLIDQGVHLAMIAVGSYLFPAAYAEGVWPVLLGDVLPYYMMTLVFIIGLIALTAAGGMMIGKLIKPFLDQLPDNAPDGLTSGGTYIGWLERSIVMVLVLTNNPSGIGFLITAKSILRFGEIKDAADRKMAEYIIIGTFMSFGWALLVAHLTAFGLAWAISF